MRDVCSLIWLALIGLFRSRASLQAEILTLRHQLNVLRRKSSQRVAFTSIDRLVFAGLYRLAPGALDALKIVRPETLTCKPGRLGTLDFICQFSLLQTKEPLCLKTHSSPRN